mmetsp:Transcript_17959/g.47014  ORF Transcript_17959/g.47014 Transcript_17959/m.47014 type:complete len:211 (+) Transcript_17959:496-1128(+)
MGFPGLLACHAPVLLHFWVGLGWLLLLAGARPHQVLHLLYSMVWRAGSSKHSLRHTRLLLWMLARYQTCTSPPPSTPLHALPGLLVPIQLHKQLMDTCTRAHLLEEVRQGLLGPGLLRTVHPLHQARRLGYPRSLGWSQIEGWLGTHLVTFQGRSLLLMWAQPLSRGSLKLWGAYQRVASSIRSKEFTRSSPRSCLVSIGSGWPKRPAHT